MVEVTKIISYKISISTLTLIMNFSFGTNYDLNFIPEAGMELVNSNWDVDNWITGNANDGFVYDGCAAFQKVLDGKTINELI